MRVLWARGNGLEWRVVPPRPPLPPVAPGPLADPMRIGLNLGCGRWLQPAHVPLNLGITACYITRPHHRSYVVLNEFEVVRLPDLLPIAVESISIAGAREARDWEVRMSLADPSHLAHLEPTAQGARTVRVTINGYAWVFMIDAFGDSETFADLGVDVRGLSVTALLDEPYAPLRAREVTQARTMQQLADMEADGSEVTVDYGTVNWLVTGGAWYYDTLSPAAALTRLAQASGAVLQAHPLEPVLQVRARYPASPWAWTTTTPDAVLSDDIVTGRRQQLQSRPMYDAVIVAGERVGVAARVRRDGEAGQTYAPQVVDALMTHADGCRERGRNVLSDRGGQALVEHDVPLFPSPLQPGQVGRLLPLQLVQRVTPAGTWHGLVTAVRIEARRQDAAVDVVQTVTLERHFTDAD